MSIGLETIRAFLYWGTTSVIFSDLMVMAMTGMSVLKMYRHQSEEIISLFMTFGTIGAVCKICFDLVSLLK